MSREHNDLDSMQITLPHGKMEKIKGFSQKKAEEYTQFIGKYYPLLKKFARQGGIGNGYTENK